MRQAIKQAALWFARSMEIDGQPSSLRLVLVCGSLSIIWTLCAVWIVACYHTGSIVDIPVGVRVLFGGALASLLGAKVGQAYGE